MSEGYYFLHKREYIIDLRKSEHDKRIFEIMRFVGETGKKNGVYIRFVERFE